MFNKKSLFYRFRMYLFGQQYTLKEKWIIGMTVVMYGAGSGIAIPVIIDDIIGFPSNYKVELINDVLQIYLYGSLYLIIFYPIFYYISKFIVETVLFLFNYIKVKLF